MPVDKLRMSYSFRCPQCERWYWAGQEKNIRAGQATACPHLEDVPVEVLAVGVVHVGDFASGQVLADQ